MQAEKSKHARNYYIPVGSCKSAMYFQAIKLLFTYVGKLFEGSVGNNNSWYP
jgi:hypothetical protein